MNDSDTKGSIWTVSAISATFIGTVVGAGFASGQEIYQFFGIHGNYGWMGLILAIIVIGIAGEKAVKIGYKFQPKSYKDFLLFILGQRLTLVVDFLLFSFFIILIGVMFAGSGAISESLHLGYWNGVIFTGLLLIIVLFFQLPGLISANLVIVPLMFAGSIGISLYAICTCCTKVTTGPYQSSWMISSIQFSAYNLILAIPVLLSLAKEYPYPSYLRVGSWLGSLGLGLMAGFIHWSLICYLPLLLNSPLPMIDLAKLAGNWIYILYAVVLWGEMFTTLLANTFGATQRLVAITGWPFRTLLIIITVIGIIIARIGFINLITSFYPIFGYLCALILFLLLIKKCDF